jgi:hypothetical protein
MRFEIGDQLNFGLRSFDFGLTPLRASPFIFDLRVYWVSVRPQVPIGVGHKSSLLF